MRDSLTMVDVEWVGEIPDLPALDEPRAAALAEILTAVRGRRTVCATPNLRPELASRTRTRRQGTRLHG